MQFQENIDADDKTEHSAKSSWDKLLIHENRLMRTSRKIKLSMTGLLVATFECLPLGILQILYSQRIKSKLATIDILSLVTSWLMLGLKVSAPTVLYELVRYKNKQRGKIDQLKMDLQVERPGHHEASIEMAAEQVPPQP